MNKIYLLLRNNKQTGPHSLEELVQQTLKPFDLVWVQGKSAGWQYPAEIDVLKSYVGEPIESSIKKDGATGDVAHPLPDKNVERKQVNKLGHLKKIFVSMPAGKPILASIEATTEKQESFADRAEKMRQKAMAFADGTLVKEEPEVDTKYARSLEDIKEEYSNWMHQQKKRKPLVLKKGWLIVAAVVLVAICLGALGVNWLNSPKIAASQPLVRNTIATPAKTPEDQEVKNSPGNKKEKNRQSKFVSKKEISQPGNSISRNLPARKITETEKEQGPDIEEKPATETVLGQIEKTTTERSQETTGLPAKTEVFAKESHNKEESLSQLINIHAKYLPGNGVGGLEIAVKNNSSETLKLVAIDVFYYDLNKKLTDKKTLYFNDLRPGHLLIQQAPENRKAVNATYQLGLVSSQNGSLYVVK